MLPGTGRSPYDQDGILQMLMEYLQLRKKKMQPQPSIQAPEYGQQPVLLPQTTQDSSSVMTGKPNNVNMFRNMNPGVNNTKQSIGGRVMPNTQTQFGRNYNQSSLPTRTF